MIISGFSFPSVSSIKYAEKNLKVPLFAERKVCLEKNETK